MMQDDVAKIPSQDVHTLLYESAVTEIRLEILRQLIVQLEKLLDDELKS